MAWVRFDDTFPEHPKVLKVGGDAAWLHVCALAYCNRLETDGVIPAAVMPRLSDRSNPARLASKLVEIGLWDVHEDGWAIHDYHDFQPSRADLEHQRAVRAEAGRRGGIKSGETRRERSKPQANASRLLEAKDERSGTPTRPDPTRPVTTQVTTQLQPPTDCPEQEGGASFDDDRTTAICAAYAVHAVTQAKARGPLRSEAGYRAKAMATARDHPDLHRLVDMFPTAPPPVIAAALHGEKGSLQYYPRSDELAEVVELRPA